MTSKAFGLAQLGNVYNDGALSNRNLIINGAMQVAQRGTTGTSTGGGYQSVDRFSYVRSGYTPSMTRSQEGEGPSGFSNSHKVLTATAATVPVSGYASIYQAIEATNLQHLNYGSSDAVPITLSFWVKSNLTGTFSVSGLHYDTSTLLISDTYNISVPDTWEYKTITFGGQTTYSIDNDTGAGLRIEWCLSAGSDYTGGSSGVWSAANSDKFAGHSVDITGTLNNYLSITGVQLEIGDTATPFEHRSYGQELALCQRYYFQRGGLNVYERLVSMFSAGTTACHGILTYPVEMRATPTLGIPTLTTIKYQQGNLAFVLSDLVAQGPSQRRSMELRGSTSGLTIGLSGWLYTNNTLTGILTFDAEL